MWKFILLIVIALAALAPLAFADQAFDYQAGVEQWQALKAKQNAPCDPSVDSTEVLTGHKTAISVLILHGYSQNPQAMADYLDFFKGYDVNIIAPRLAHHFDADIHSLDSVNKQQWIAQSQEAFEAAQKLGSQVIVAGYSLGGLLASRLALNPRNSKSLVALVLLSPALRLSGNVELGAAVASIFSRTGNEWMKMAPPACGSATPYLSVNGGSQVVSLMRSTDRAYPQADGTVYKKIFAMELDSSIPVFLSVVNGDEVVNSEMLKEMATPIPSNGYLTFLSFNNRDQSKSPHSMLTTAEVRQSQIFPRLATFLKDWTNL